MEIDVESWNPMLPKSGSANLIQVYLEIPEGNSI